MFDNLVIDSFDAQASVVAPGRIQQALEATRCSLGRLRRLCEDWCSSATRHDVEAMRKEFANELATAQAFH